jgi:hypothetical protein
LEGSDKIRADGLIGYGSTVTVNEIGERFSRLQDDWQLVPGHVGDLTAIAGDQGDLFLAASKTFFDSDSDTKVVIFGHTHEAVMTPLRYDERRTDDSFDPEKEPYRKIYANSGTWVDHPGYQGNYVETRENGNTLHVRVARYEYDGSHTIEAGFVDIQS